MTRAPYRASKPVRALVHFAVAPELVYMTTRLAGKETFFLPFNRGKDGGAGNPPHPSSYPSGYLWEEVWAPESFLDILGHFMHLQREERWGDGKKETKERLLFPRYHQLDAVRRLVEAARREGPGKSYLILSLGKSLWTGFSKVRLLRKFLVRSRQKGALGRPFLRFSLSEMRALSERRS